MIKIHIIDTERVVVGRVFLCINIMLGIVGTMLDYKTGFSLLASRTQVEQ